MEQLQCDGLKSLLVQVLAVSINRIICKFVQVSCPIQQGSRDIAPPFRLYLENPVTSIT